MINHVSDASEDDVFHWHCFPIIDKHVRCSEELKAAEKGKMRLQVTGSKSLCK